MTALSLFPESNPEQVGGIRFRIDWFAFTVKGALRSFVLELVAEVLGPEWRTWEVLRRAERRERTKGPFGSLMEVDWKEKWVHVQIKGQGCGAVGVEQLMRLHDVLLAKLGAAYIAKRVDVAWDDYTKSITPAQFRERFWDAARRCKRLEVVCKAKRGHAREDDGPEGGGSYTVGERVSKRLLRIYDKAAESGGKVNAVRIELECKEEVAGDVLHAMAASIGNRSAAALRFLVGFIDFRDVEFGKTIRERRRSAWWQAFVGEAKKAKLSAVERKGMEEWRETFTHQGSSGFRLLVHLRGGDIKAAAEELFRKNPRDNPRHEVWHADLHRLAAEEAAAAEAKGTAGDGDAVA
ncbi:MAG: replication initiation factor domain-containing protein [Planctomycetia bacterium]|nr:replication initiation factor domain-containing protein [Planctomycetia bacterium]